MDKQLDELLEAGIIKESQGSQWASPIMLVKKPSGNWRFCSDMRYLNSCCRVLHYKLPTIDDVKDVMSRNQAKVLTSLNMRAAYYQLWTSPATAEFSTFSTPHRGSYFLYQLPHGDTTCVLLFTKFSLSK